MNILSKLLPGYQHVKGVKNNRKQTRGRKFYYQQIWKKDENGNNVRLLKTIKHILE